MNAALIKNWNDTVKKDDIIYHLGDFAFANKATLEELVPTLHGRKRLIRGNHDYHPNQWYRDIGFEEVYDKPIIYGGFYILSHEPVYLTEAMPYVNIHGHIHGKTMTGANYYNVCVEQTEYKPVNFKTIVAKYKDITREECAES
jgi:calcineurin-like phosphoesterase family protein